MAQSLLPRYAEAQTISFTDERIKAFYVDYPSPGGTSGDLVDRRLQRQLGERPVPEVGAAQGPPGPPQRLAQRPFEGRVGHRERIDAGAARPAGGRDQRRGDADLARASA